MSCRYANAKYMTIAELIDRRLRTGEFLSGGEFYSRDELARAYHISPGTARAVLRVLKDRGIISCRKGRRPVPTCLAEKQEVGAVCRPVFFRDSHTAESPEYDYLVYCMRNLLMRGKTGLIERNTDLFFDSDETAPPPDGSVAVVFPSGSETHSRPEPPIQTSSGRIDLLIDQAGSDAVSIFTRKACPDCLLHLIRHDFGSVIRVASKHSAFPWFESIVAPGVLDRYAPGCRADTIVFDDELELFPDHLAEVLGTCAQDQRTVAILLDDPCLSDYLSGEIRTGTYHPPPLCSFFGTAFSERSMVFPYLDLRLDALAGAILKTAVSKAEYPGVSLACEFHLIQFRTPGIR